MKGSNQGDPANRGHALRKPLVVGMIGALFFAFGCTKERPYEKVKEDGSSQARPIAKSLLSSTEEYLYLPSSLNSTRTTDATFPMYMGEAKIVKLQISEKFINVVEVESDERFGQNPVNEKPVLSIPIEHLDYTCTKDADGKCTNREELDRAKPWAQRNYLRVNGDQLAVQEINFLPIEITNLFYPCYSEVGAAFSNVSVDSEAINISVEKSYKTDLGCGGKISQISDLTFRAVYHYSLVKLSRLISADYTPLAYRRSEETSFGYFDSRTLKLDRDNNTTVGGEKVFLNRWNPNKKVIYYLSENFNKPEHAKIKAATIAGVNNINQSLALAGAPLRIELRDPVPGQNPADLRVNTIVMIEDPVNFGILGYGPTAANPRTGEILHGRTAMYLGVIKTGIERAYSDVVKERLSQIEKAKASTKVMATPGGSGSLVTHGENSAGPMSLAPELLKFTGLRPKIDAQAYANIKRAIESANAALSSSGSPGHTHAGTDTSTVSGSLKKSGLASQTRPSASQVNRKKLLAYAERRNERRLTIRDAAILKDDPSIREQILSTHCFFELDNFNVHGSIEDEIVKLVDDLGARPWTALSDNEKDRVIDTLLPFVWIPTLIHEVGHNLGLRHNFAGSEDGANFYTKAELAEMGIQRTFAYSSVMDYGYRSTNELQVMGKYDIAALRFGYAEKVEVIDPDTNVVDIIPLEQFRSKADLTLKPYKYCTDEHVAVNPNCNRFDEGTTLVGMAEHWMTMYEESYARRNFRNGLYDFSLYDDSTQIRRVGLTMSSLRSLFERYEDLKKTFGLSDDSPYWNDIDFLKDMKQATLMAGHFFIKVLETPDTLCAVAEAKSPNTIIGVLELRKFSPFAVSCFDKENVQLNPNFVVVGQAGKSFQSRKDPRSGNPYIDQIDIRGIWIDKLLAAKALVGRLTGIETFDEFAGNFLDIAEMRKPVEEALSALLLDEVVTQVPIYTITGQVLVAELPVRLFDKEEAQNGHKIPKPLHPGVRAYFDIPNNGIHFQAKLLQILRQTLPSQEQLNDEHSFLNAILVNTSLPLGQSPEEFLSTSVGLQRIFVNMKSAVAAAQLIHRDIVMAFDSLGAEKLQKILSDILSGKPAPDDASDAEKLAHMVGAEVVGRYLQGGFQDRRFYELMLMM